MNVLITGGCGFIGSRLAQALLGRGDKVTVMDNLDEGPNHAFKLANCEKLVKSGARFIKCDIADVASFDSVGEEKFDAVIHLAARSDVRSDNIQGYVKDNVQGMVNVLEFCRSGGTKNLIFASSSAVYGKRTSGFDEGSATDEQISLYGTTKKFGENMCSLYSNSYGMNCTVLRFFTVYGPGGRLDMAIPKFIQQIDAGNEIELFAQGDISKDFVYIDDVVDAITKALEKPLGFDIINIGTGQSYKIQDVVKAIENILGKPAKTRLVPNPAGNATASKASITKAERILGWKPKTGLEEGINQTAKWWLAEGKGVV